MRILIVGATGALGRDVVEAALHDGHDTAALVRDPARAGLPEAVELVAGDVLDASSLRAAVEGREAVICALGTASPRRRARCSKRGRGTWCPRWTRPGCAGWCASRCSGLARAGRTRR